MKVNSYDKIYFFLYSILSKFGKYDLGFKAMMLFSFLIFVHFLSVVYLIYDTSELEWLGTYFGVIIVALPIVVFNYFYFVFNYRYERISEIMQSRYRGNMPEIGGISFILISIVLLLLIIIK